MYFKEQLIHVSEPKKRDFFPEKFSNEIYCSRMRGEEKFTYHSDYSMKYIGSGMESYLIDGKFHSIQSNQVLLIPAGCLVETIFCDSEAVSVFLDEELVREIYDTEYGAHDIEGFNHETIVDFHPFVSSRCDEIKVVLNGLLSETLLEESSPIDADLYYGLGKALIDGGLRINREIDSIDRIKPATRAEIYRKLEMAYSMIMDGYVNPLLLDDLSKEAGMSKYNLIKHFKQVYEQTPKQLQIERRISRAREMLSQGDDLSVQEVATALGYADVASFSNQFKEKTGESPSSVKHC